MQGARVFCSFLVFGIISCVGCVITGEIVHLSLALSSHGHPIFTHYLHANNTLYALDLSDYGGPEISTGHVANIKGVISNDIMSKQPVIHVESIQLDKLTQLPKARTKTTGLKNNVTSIVYALETCGSLFHDMELLNKNLVFLNEYLSGCTLGSLQIPRDTSLVIGPIQIPCTTDCAANDLYMYAQYAKQFVQNMHNLDVSGYQHHMFMLSSHIKCKWAGLGTIGCPSNGCYTWYSGRHGYDASILLHELGHNFGLHHSSTHDDEYGDTSCIMGMASDLMFRCFNAPQSINLGVTESKYTLDIQTFTNTSDVLHLYLQSHVESAKSSVTLKIGHTYFVVSLRTPVLFDAFLYRDHHNKVFVHSTKKKKYATLLVAILSPGQSYVIEDHDVAIRFRGLRDNQHAHVCVEIGLKSLHPS